MEASILKSITTVTKDGEWGKGEPFPSSVEMAVIRGTDFENARVGVLDNVPTRHIPAHIAARKRLQSYDILIETAGGTMDQPTGRTMLVKPSLLSKSPLPLTCASFARFIRIDQAKADPEFVFWLLQSVYSDGSIRQYHTQHTGVARFQFTTFAEREPLPLPSINTQKRIASVLSAYDDLIENNTRRIKILEQMAQMIYLEWFVNFRYPGHEKVQMVESHLGPIPNAWTIKSLGDLTAVVTKGTTPTTLGRQFQESGVNFAKVESITQSGAILIDKLAKIDTETHELLKRSQLRKDDILFSIAGAIGRVAVVPLRVLPANTNQALAIIRCSDPNFVTYLLSTVRSAHFQNFSLGRVVQTAQANVSLSILKSAPILVPPPTLLKLFQQTVEPILRLVDINSSRIGNLRTTRDFLLPKLISGEIPVDAVDDKFAELMEQVEQPT
jgi:type I restriction enzyme S subunit